MSYAMTLLREELNETCKQRDALDHECSRLETALAASEARVAELRARCEALDVAAAKWHKLAEEAVYSGLCIGVDCAGMLAELQDRGVYRPRCDDGKPSNASARRDAETLAEMYSRGRAMLNEHRAALLSEPSAPKASG